VKQRSGAWGSPCQSVGGLVAVGKVAPALGCEDNITHEEGVVLIAR